MMRLPSDTLWACRDVDLSRMIGQFRFQPKAFGQTQPAATKPRIMAGGIAIIQLVGVLEKRQSMFGWLFGGTGMADARDYVMAAAANESIGGILLYIDSPGGTTSGTGDLADAVRQARTVKPVYAYISDLGASAAYWIASQATRVYSNPYALVGSIGTYMAVADWSAAYENDGIKIHVVKAGEFKGTGVMGSEVTDAQLAELQRIVDAVNREFLKGVSVGRNLPMDRVRALADGRLHVGAEATRQGLIDGIGSFEAVLTELAGGYPGPAAKKKTAPTDAHQTKPRNEFEEWRRRQGYHC